MGYSYRNNGKITDFWPDDTDDKVYVCETTDLNTIIDAVKGKWGEINFDLIEISAERIHTYCLTYDLHDPSDYTNFIVVERLRADEISFQN